MRASDWNVKYSISTLDETGGEQLHPAADNGRPALLRELWTQVLHLRLAALVQDQCVVTRQPPPRLSLHLPRRPSELRVQQSNEHHSGWKRRLSPSHDRGPGVAAV